MDNGDDPEILAVAPLPTVAERRRREIMLARLMLLATDLVLSGEGIGLQSARDLVLEIWNCYPELVVERNNL